MGHREEVVDDLEALVALEQATYRMRADEQWEIGQRVRIGWHPEHCMVLS